MEKISRRTFGKVSLIGGAGLLLQMSVDPFGSGDEPGDFSPTIFIKLGPGGTVDVLVPKSEMGQGINTAVAMMVAEELEVGMENINVATAPYKRETAKQLGNQNTGGSTSVKELWPLIRMAAASTKEMLITAAAQKWNVPVAQCKAENGFVVAGSERIAYASLLQTASTLPLPETPKLKSQSFKVVGSSMPRKNAHDVVRGRVSYGIDVEIESMVYASVERCPVAGGKVSEVDSSQARSMPGVIDVVEVKGSGPGARVRNGVAVVATNYWSAEKARKLLKIEWDYAGNDAESTETIQKKLLSAVESEGRKLKEAGNVDEIFAGAGKKSLHEARYTLPFLTHAPMEPMNCTADSRDGKVIIWGPLQFPEWAVLGISREVGVKADDVIIHITSIGGGFGRRINFDYAVEAALISKSVNLPVKVLWTRADDLQMGFYRPAAAHMMKASFDTYGFPEAWHHHLASTTINVWGDGTDPTNETLGGIAGDLVYPIPNLRTEYSGIKSAIPRGWWRSVEYSFNVFAVESFMDELAVQAKKDPLDYRLELLKRQKSFGVSHPFWGTKTYHPERHIQLLETLKEKSSWISGKKKGEHWGMATLMHFGLDSMIAIAVRISYQSNKIKVEEVMAVTDAGLIINPLGARAQIEGGINQGLSASLFEEITVTNGAVDQRRLSQYHILRIDEAPQIDVHFIEGGLEPGGVGELPVPVVAPALANAIFSATGKRIRDLPLIKHFAA